MITTPAHACESLERNYFFTIADTHLRGKNISTSGRFYCYVIICHSCIYSFTWKKYLNIRSVHIAMFTLLLAMENFSDCYTFISQAFTPEDATFTRIACLAIPSNGNSMTDIRMLTDILHQSKFTLLGLSSFAG